MKNLILIILTALALPLMSQTTIRPMCDDGLTIPLSFTYNGFIIREANNVSVGQINTNQNIRLEIAEESPSGNILYSENFSIPYNLSGFFNLDIGQNSSEEFNQFIQTMNDNSDTEYYFVVNLRNDQNFQYEFIGSKKIMTVPYAYVSNMLGGMGANGIEGPTGPQGPQGEQGPQGSNPPVGPTGDIGVKGENGFGILIMTDTIPTDKNIYVDDGTNTADGNPHLRYNNNGTWIDL